MSEEQTNPNPTVSLDNAFPKAVIETLKPLLEDVTVENLMKIIPVLIKHVEMYKDFTGEQKKNMVVNMLKHLIDVTDGPGNDEIFDPILKRMVPGIIDTLVDVDRGNLKLNTKKIKKLHSFNVFSKCSKLC